MSEIENKPIYVASRASNPCRPAMWRSMRAEGARICSSWIDEAGEGETSSLSELWQRIADEIRQSVALVLYAEQEDFPLKGALIEVGIALGMGKPVIICLPKVELSPRSFRPIGSWINHPLVTRIDAVHEAVRVAQLFGTRVPGVVEAKNLPLQGKVRTSDLNTVATKEEVRADDGWEWIRSKILACTPEIALPQRNDSFAGTKYEVMGWMHVLCSYAQSANHCYLSIAVEQQKRAETAETEVKEREAELGRTYDLISRWSKSSNQFEADVERLKETIRKHRSQKADDRCVEDDDELYAVLGDGIKCDRRVGDKAAMLRNCERFISNRCEGGGWKSYAELEAENEHLKEAIATVLLRLSDSGLPTDIANTQTLRTVLKGEPNA